jgi:phosphate starvation-inducible membrane PsiE
MDYFRIVSYVLGGLMIFSPVTHYLKPQAYADFVLEKIYTQKRSMWMNLLAVLGTVLVMFSWYQCVHYLNGLSLTVCLVLTLSLIKIGLILFRYQEFRKLIVELLTREKVALRIMMACSMVMGFGLLVIGIMMSRLA